MFGSPSCTSSARNRTCWKNDAEYNRMGNIPKVLGWKLDAEGPQAVYPDIIIHHRGRPSNLAVLEAKKSGKSDIDDRRKLLAFKHDPDFAYRYAVLLTLETGAPPNITFELL